MKKRQKLAALFILVVLLLASCAPVAAPAPTKESPAPMSAQQVPAPAAAPAKPAWQIEWDKTVAAARKEGTVVLITSAAGVETRQLVVNGFKSKYGITVEWLAGQASALATRLLAERRAGIYSTDLGIIGTTPPLSILKPAGVLERLDRVLLLPELTEPEEMQKVWPYGKLMWLDKDRTMLAFAPRVQESFWVNTTLVKSGEIESYKDLLDPKWKGRIVMSDPTVGSGSVIVLLLAVVPAMGRDYLHKLAEQQPVLHREERLGPEWVARGKYPIGFGFKGSIFLEFQSIGAPVAPVRAKEGLGVTTGSSVITLLKDAPHPNAAKLFINWLLTKEGQIAYCTGYRTPSGRTDVSIEGLDEYRISPKEKYVFTGTEEEYGKMPEVVKMAREIFKR